MKTKTKQSVISWTPERDRKARSKLKKILRHYGVPENEVTILRLQIDKPLIVLQLTGGPLDFEKDSLSGVGFIPYWDGYFKEIRRNFLEEYTGKSHAFLSEVFSVLSSGNIIGCDHHNVGWYCCVRCGDYAHGVPYVPVV